MMSQIQRLALSVWSESWFDRVNTISTLYHKCRSVLIYRPAFREFGKGSQIRNPILISHPKFISIGEHVLIRDGARLEAIQSNPRREPMLRIGDGSNIEQNVHIVCHSRVEIGNNVSITAQCAIVDVTHPYNDVADGVCIGSRILDEESFVEIGNGSFLGIGTVVLPNVRIGKYVVTGARSVIANDVPDYCVVAGAPARVIRRYDEQCGRWIRV